MVFDAFGSAFTFRMRYVLYIAGKKLIENVPGGSVELQETGRGQVEECAGRTKSWSS